MKNNVFHSRWNFLLTNMVWFFMSCNGKKDASEIESPSVNDSVIAAGTKNTDDAVRFFSDPSVDTFLYINTGKTTPGEIVDFAKTLQGIPYLYASTDPAKGFDCSGFITYVFNHFNIRVPRSSVDFTSIGREIDYRNAGPGDLILFTGTDSTIRIVGHMGIVESNGNDRLQFIHSSSGKGRGVVITPLEDYYKSRFVKVIRIFPEEFFK